MAARDKAESRLSFAGRDPELRIQTPVSLRRLRALRIPFDHARDPSISAQLKALEKTESQRREEQGQGSKMVKLHKPFPELKPKEEGTPLRASFNRAWLSEQRAAMLERFKAERAHRAQHEERGYENAHQMKGRER